jgi:hypothetical protein
VLPDTLRDLAAEVAIRACREGDRFDGGAPCPLDHERERRLTVKVDRIHARFGFRVWARDPASPRMAR